MSFSHKIGSLFAILTFPAIICGVRLTGLEPARRETPDPKSDASTNSATGAFLLSFLICGCKGTNFFSFHQEFTGKFYQRIFSLDKVGICERHFIVGVDAEFRLLVMAVVHGACREAHRPAIGEGRGEGHTSAATSMIAHNLRLRHALHVFHELVGSAVHLAIGQHHHVLVPSQIARGLDMLGLHLREVVVALARLVLQVAHERLLVAEACRQSLGIGKVAAAIAPDVDDQSVAEQEVLDDLVETALADAAAEAAVVDIADVIIEDTVLHAAGDAIVGAEVAALQGVAEVRGIVLVPLPVASVVEGREEVHVAVAQFGEHVGEHLEELLLADHVVRAYLIYIIYLLPVESVFMLLVVEEAVVLVDNLPECLEVPLWRIFVLDFVDTRGEG